MSTFEILIRIALLTVGTGVICWALVRLDTGDAELHEAAAREKLRRQRDAWTSPDGRTIR